MLTSIAPAAAFVSSSEVCRWYRPGVLTRNPDDPDGRACPTIVDDDVVRMMGVWEPWTMKPLCTRPTNYTIQKYCTFTHSTKGGPGSSFITTPEIALKAARIVDDPVWQRRKAASINDFNPPYEVKPVAGMGLGAIATRNIKFQEVVVSEFPFIADLVEAPGITGHEAMWLLEKSFEQLPRADQKRVLAMARSSEGHVIADVLRTNAFGVTIKGAHHSGLYAEIAVSRHLRGA